MASRTSSGSRKECHHRHRSDLSLVIAFPTAGGPAPCHPSKVPRSCIYYYSPLFRTGLSAGPFYVLVLLGCFFLG